MEQTKLVFTWKDTNTVWQCFLCRPDKQKQDGGLERRVFFREELILFSFKNVSLLLIYRIFQNDVFVGHVNRWKRMNISILPLSHWEGLRKKYSLRRRNGYAASFSFPLIGLWGRRHFAYILKTLHLSAAVLQTDDGRNRLRVLPKVHGNKNPSMNSSLVSWWTW